MNMNRDIFIGLCIITIAIIAAIIVIVWLVKRTVSFTEHVKSGYGKNPKPWLRKKEWVNRKVIWKGVVRGSLVFAVFAIAIFPILIALIINIHSFNKTNLLEIIPFLMVLAPIFGYFMYTWLQSKKFSRSICYLDSLPGEIGGFFKAKVEMYFPNEQPYDVNLILRLISYSNPFTHIPDIWEKKYIVRREEIEYRGKKKYMVPVNIDIPIDPPLKKYKNSWFLVLKINSPGINYYSNFNIPIFDIKKYE
jgi:hypothetical protein